MTVASWPLWALVLFFQNISFTYVSRARSSGSLWRHLKASIFSNGIWVFSNMLMLGPLFDYLTGKHGIIAQALTGALYTASAVSGSIFAHYLAMKTEKGKDAVGFNKKYAQIPVEEWKAVQDYFQNLKELEASGKTLAGFTPATLELIERLPQLSADVEKLPTELARVSEIAHQAYDITVGMIPDAGIKALKVGDLVVTPGLPENKS